MDPEIFFCFSKIDFDFLKEEISKISSHERVSALGEKVTLQFGKFKMPQL